MRFNFLDSDEKNYSHDTNVQKVISPYVASSKPSTVSPSDDVVVFSHSNLDVYVRGRNEQLALDITGMDHLIDTHQLSVGDVFDVIVSVTDADNKIMLTGKVDEGNQNLDVQKPYVRVVKNIEVNVNRPESGIYWTNNQLTLSEVSVFDAADPTSNYFYKGNDKVYEVNVSIMTPYEIINGKDALGVAEHMSAIGSPSDKVHALSGLTATYIVGLDAQAPVDNNQEYKGTLEFNPYADEDWLIVDNEGNRTMHGGIQFYYNLEDPNIHIIDGKNTHVSRVSVSDKTIDDDEGLKQEGWYRLNITAGQGENNESLNPLLIPIEDGKCTLNFVLNDETNDHPGTTLENKVVTIVGVFRPTLTSYDLDQELIDIFQEDLSAQIHRSLYHQDYRNEINPESRQAVAWIHLVDKQLTGETLTLTQVNTWDINASAEVKDGSEIRLDGVNSNSTKAFRTEPTGLDETPGATPLVESVSVYNNDTETQLGENHTVTGSAYPDIPDGPYPKNERFDLLVFSGTNRDEIDTLLTLGSKIRVTIKAESNRDSQISSNIMMMKVIQTRLIRCIYSIFKMINAVILKMI